MRALQFTAPGEAMRYVDVPDPTAAPGWVVIDVEAAGMCRSDVHIMDGHGASWLSKVPMILGHEVAGRISSLGDGVTEFAVGDRVGVCATPGPDEHSRPFGPGSDQGADGGSLPGVQVDGGYAEQCAVRASRLVRIPDNVSYELAAIGTDALTTGYHAVRNTGRVRFGERVGIIGLGGLGMSGLRTAVLAGAQTYGVDVREQVFADARANGAIDCFTEVASLAELDLDLIVDFVGAGTTTNEAIKAVRPRGRVVLVGLDRPEMTIETTPFVIRRVQLLTSTGVHKDDLVQVYRLLSEGALTPVLEEFAFSDLAAAADRLRRGDVVGRQFTRPRVWT